MCDVIFRVVVFGDLGLTTLFRKFVKTLYNSDSKRRIGVDFYTKHVMVSERLCKLYLSDINVKERFRYLLPALVTGANGVIILFNTSNYSSLVYIDDWLIEIRRAVKIGDQLRIILVGLNFGHKRVRKLTHEEIILITQHHGVFKYIECKSLTEEVIEKILEVITKAMLCKTSTSVNIIPMNK